MSVLLMSWMKNNNDNDVEVTNYNDWTQPKSACQQLIFFQQQKKGKTKLRWRKTMTNTEC